MIEENDLPLINPETDPNPVPLILFVNPKSGGELGSQLIHVVQDDPTIHIVVLPNDIETWSQTNMDVIQNPFSRIVIAGGDGSMNWVVSLLFEFYSNAPPDLRRPPICVIPLGTGNDLSRALGWGKGMTSHKIKKIDRILTPIRLATHLEDVDIWELVVTTNSTGEQTKYHLLNYFSLGIDGEIAYEYEKKRETFKTRIGSFLSYVPTSLSAMIHERPMKDYCTASISLQNQSQTIEFQPKEKTIIFQAIPSMYAGKDPWNSPIPRSMDDHKCEVMAHKGVMSLGFEQMGIKSGRVLGQCDYARLEVSEPCCFQIDGEGIPVSEPSVFEFHHFGTYPMYFKK